MPQSISIVTPCLGMARFLPSCVESVLACAVPGLEYLVYDGGSTDGTREILRRYEGRLQWRSEPDQGAAQALARGFAAAQGEILGWLNADDVLQPGALAAVLDAFENNPQAIAVFSGGLWVDEEDQPIRPYPVARNAAGVLDRECLICQPACFFRASAYRACGGIDPSLRSAFDYDLWIRLSHLGPLVFVPGRWAWSRMHPANKTLGRRAEVFEESMRVLRRHYSYVPFQWVYSSLVHRLDGRDQFFEPLRPSLRAYVASLPAGLRRNGRHPWRYTLDWASQIGRNGWRRLLLPGTPY